MPSLLFVDSWFTRNDDSSLLELTKRGRIRTHVDKALMSALKPEKKRIRRQRRTKEIVRFWFAIYQALKCNDYLRGVLELESALRDSAPKYRLWGDVTKTTEFEQWWRKYRDSFIEAPSVQVITSDKIERKPKQLYVSISLEKAPAKLLAALKGEDPAGTEEARLAARWAETEVSASSSRPL
jgi:hypothetical protein